MMNFEVRIDGKTVDLDPNTGYDLEILNPMSGWDSFTGSKATNIQLPFHSQRNHEIMHWLADTQVQTSREFFLCEKYLNTSLIEKGWVILRDATESYSLDFTVNLKEFFGTLQSRSLSEIDLGSIPVPASYSATLENSWNNGGFVFPTVLNPDYFGGQNPGNFTGKVNEYGSGDYTTSVKVPYFFAKWVLKKLANLAGITLHGAAWESELLNRVLIGNTRAIEGATIQPRLHLPNYTVAGFLVNLLKVFRIVPFFDTHRRKLRLEFGAERLRGITALDWTEKMQRKQGGTPSGVSGLEISYTLDSNDAMTKDEYFFPYTTPGITANDVAGSLLKIQIGFAPYLMQNGLPYSKQPGIVNSQSDKTFGPRIAFWHGLVNGVPLASNTWNGYDLRLTGSNGLAQKWWSVEENFQINALKIVRDVALSPADLAKLSSIFRGESAERPIVYAHGRNWFIEKVVVPSDDPKLSQVTLCRL
ncbi:hypothetical protein [Siphonobacter sp. SORGH_AS_0500]|uniref:hypothetical protein n=1 Tax=Siphonobacter sp. SORGH_AS_0500 TaxID=1864824 RepID=UPI002866EEDF|nr:hypothetical protein [Siphonobacter sp. SORGH_AS_0500]MDR6194707.1 hypothetical protein [Siphonobacter sp. SORGH_AS_0500]